MLSLPRDNDLIEQTKVAAIAKFGYPKLGLKATREKIPKSEAYGIALWMKSHYMKLWIQKSFTR